MPESPPGMDEPGILIEFSTVLCPRHGEPFRPRWPLGYTAAALCLTHQALNRQDIQDACGGKVEAITATLIEYGPLCCLVGDTVTAAITDGALTDDHDAALAMLRQYGPGRPS